ncbi:uncharacterized protein PAC_00110 [Phialocephala subalpina]|uniref:BTB domain-containing protein n=1 Tax=Phialocephala subalpina TaxID=576137 RepID=A0A1L7WBS5_9HELO|nr:uncharacterized protein PAC_00110 [Phialocephala subalpina]
MVPSLKRQRKESQTVANSQVLRSRTREQENPSRGAVSQQGLQQPSPSPDLAIIPPSMREDWQERQLPAMDEDAPFIEKMGTEFVTIFGSSKFSRPCIKFSAHKNLVCKASRVLKERLEFQATLPAADIRHELYFNDLEGGHWSANAQDFVNLLYRERKAIIDRVRTYEECFHLYRFADTFEVDGLRDIAIDVLQDRLKNDNQTLTSLVDLKRVFAYTEKSPKNKLYRFYTALMAYDRLTTRSKDVEEITKQMEFNRDLNTGIPISSRTGLFSERANTKKNLLVVALAPILEIASKKAMILAASQYATSTSTDRGKGVLRGPIMDLVHEPY